MTALPPGAAVFEDEQWHVVVLSLAESDEVFVARTPDDVVIWILAGDFVMLYGVVDCRCAAKEDDFGALGANTAHGRTPTKRSPTGLASGDS